MSAERPRQPAGRRRPSGRAAFNYYSAGRQPDNQPRAKTSGRRSFIKRLVKRLSESVVLLLVGLVLIYSLIVNSNPAVSSSSQLYHDQATYGQAVKAAMSGFWDRNKVTFDQDALSHKLQQQYPEIRSVNVRLPLLSQRANVQLDIAQPGFKLISSRQAYLVGEQGVVIAAANPKQWPNLPVLQDSSGYQIQIGKPALDATSINFINLLLAQLKTAKVPVQSMSLPAKAQELDLRTTDRGYFIKFYLGSDPLPAIGQYLAARHHFDKSHHQPASYLDDRVPGKIFYR